MPDAGHLCLLMSSAVYATQTTPTKKPIRPYLREPALSPDSSEIAFCYAGDIWTVPATGGQARRITSHPAYDAAPMFSPDGTQLAFASQRTGGGNIYVISLRENSAPRRLTYDNASAPPNCWSPDGAWIYFTSNYDGLSGAIHKVHLDGGTPIKLIADPRETHYNVAVSPDGKTLAFNNNGHQWWRHGPNPAGHSDIWVVSEAAGADDFRRLTRYLGRNLRPMWNAAGNGLYYLSDRDDKENIWFMSLEGDAEAEQITHFEGGRVLRPAISADGKWIVFERGFQLWRLNLETSDATPVEIVVYTDEKSNPIQHHTHTGNLSEFSLSPDGKKTAFVVHGEVLADLSDKGDKVKKGGDSFKVTHTPFRESQVQWHPESNRIVYVSDRTGNNEIFSYDFKKHEETQLTNSSTEKYLPKFSPDGKWLAYIHGNSDIYLMNTETGEHRPFVTGQIFMHVPVPTDFAWSPDSKWIAFLATDARFFANLYAQHVDESEPKQLTFLSNVLASQLLWAPNGRFIIFNTGQYRSEFQIARVDLQPVQPLFKEEDFEKLFEEKKEEKEKDENAPKPPEAEKAATTLGNGSPTADEENKQNNGEESKDKKKKPIEPVVIKFGDIQHRLRFLTNFRLNAHALCIRPDSKTLIFGASLTGQPNLWSLSLEEDKQQDLPKQLTWTAGGKGDVQFSADGNKRFFYLDGGRIHSLGIGEDGSKEGDPKALDTRAEIEVDFHAEKMQAFDEAWRFMRDHFYDPEFHGCNWEAVKQTFRPMVEGAQTQTDFRELLNLMVGELNASHLGASGSNDGAPDSFLAVDFDREALEQHGHFKIANLPYDSPLLLPEQPAAIGEYLVEVDGTVLNGQTNLPELFQRKAGKRVRLKVNTTPTVDGARELTVQPLDPGRHGNLRYRDWVRWNEQYVHARSNGRLGYAHIREMSYGAYVQFQVDLDTETHDREGVVVDVRFNPGGHIAPFILDVLSRKAYTRAGYRRSPASTVDTHLAGNRIWEKPVLLVTNEHSGSNAEMFTEGFRRLGLGKVVGMPTAGAVIWTWGWQLLDGTGFRLPRLSVTTLEGENTEGHARPVDVEVDRPLGEAARGQDGQLDAAITNLLAQIDGEPR